MKNEVDLTLTINHDIQLQENETIASDVVSETLNSLRELKKQAKVLDELIKQQEAIIKTYMKEATILRDANGTIAVTWEYTNPSIDVDKEALRIHFNDVYSVVCIEKPGTRRFVVK